MALNKINKKMINGLEEDLGSITTQLAEKAAKGEVRESTLTLPIDVSEMNTATKQLFTGGAVAVVGVNAVGNENLKEKAVTPRSTTFISEYPNLIDKGNVKLGYVSTQNGISESIWYDMTDYIQVRNGETFTFSRGINYVSFHDNNKQYVNMINTTSRENVPYTFTVNADGYIIGTFFKSKTEEIVLNRGTSADILDQRHGFYLDTSVIDIPRVDSLDDLLTIENETWEVN